MSCKPFPSARRATVSIEGCHRALNLEVLSPCSDGCKIVRAVHNHIRDTISAISLQFSLLFRIARNCLCRSGGSKCTGQAHHDHLNPDDLFEEHFGESLCPRSQKAAPFANGSKVAPKKTLTRNGYVVQSLVLQLTERAIH